MRRLVGYRARPLFRFATSMLSFHVKRAGIRLPAVQRARLDAVTDELRVLFDRPRRRG
ncbi:MAG: DUF3175 domain-containing protein [Acidobacteriota bacterium]|nr:DUF3175 domain-containing protein [Acidobacteriota bacterium]